MKNNQNLQKPWWRDGVILFIRISTYIAFPVIVASFLGKFLDNKYKTNNLFFLILIAIAFLSTIYLIWREAKIYKKEMDKIEKIEKDNK